jgi:hypothetical protein
MARRKRVPRLQRSEHELRTYSAEHLKLSLEALFVIGQQLRENPVPVGRTLAEWGDMTARIQAFGIFLRLLVQFFYPTGSEDNDVVAEEYCLDPLAWKTLRGKCHPILLEACERTSKELAHLTTEWIPGRPDRKIWDVAPLLAEVLELARRFVSVADPSRLDGSVSSLVTILQRRLRLDLSAQLLDETMGRQVVAQTSPHLDMLLSDFPAVPRKGTT